MPVTTIPDTCTFVGPTLFMTKTGKENLLDLGEKADKRNQDLHGLYIYNDFSNYGFLDLIQKTLSTIHYKIIKHNYDEAYSLFEALLVFATTDEFGWTCVDDGELVEITHKVLGALLLNLIRNLKKGGRLDLEHFPTLLGFLRSAVDLGGFMVGLFEDMGRYDHVCQAIAFRLMNGREDEQAKIDKARQTQWLASLPSSQRREMRQALKESVEEGGGEAAQNSWWRDGEQYDEDEKHPDFAMVRVWKEYKDHLEGGCLLPFWGPPEWDLTQWTEQEKEEFRTGRSYF